MNKQQHSQKNHTMSTAQMDAWVTKATNISPTQGKNQSRKAEHTLRQNKKFVNRRRHEHNDNSTQG